MVQSQEWPHGVAFSVFVGQSQERPHRVALSVLVWQSQEHPQGVAVVALFRRITNAIMELTAGIFCEAGTTVVQSGFLQLVMGMPVISYS